MRPQATKTGGKPVQHFGSRSLGRFSLAINPHQTNAIGSLGARLIVTCNLISSCYGLFKRSCMFSKGSNIRTFGGTPLYAAIRGNVVYIAGVLLACAFLLCRLPHFHVVYYRLM